MNSSSAGAMKEKRYRFFLITSALLLLLLALVSESVYFSDFEYRQRTKRFNKILTAKETKTENYLNISKLFLGKGEDFDTVSRSNVFKTLEAEGVTLLWYLDNKLVYWSDNSFDIPRQLDDSLFSKPLVRIHNGWFITKYVKSGNEAIIALLRLSNDFGFENDLVKNGFVKSFKVPAGTAMNFNEDSSEFMVCNKEGKWLFSLDYPQIKKPSWFIIIPAFSWACTLAMVVLLVTSLVKFLAAKGRKLYALISAILVFSAIYFVVLVFRKPAVYFETELFSAYRFSLNSFIPSLGHLFVLSILLSVLAYMFYRYSSLKMLSKSRFLSSVWITVLFMAAAALFILYHWIFSELIYDSNISFEPYKVLELSVFSFVGFISVILLLLVPVFFILKIVSESQHMKTGMVILAVTVSLIVFPVSRVLGYQEYLWPLMFYYLISLSIWFSFRRRIGMFNMTVLFSLYFGLYALYNVLVLSDKKNIENKKVLAVSYSSEHDPEAEHLLLDIWPRISGDTVLKKMLSSEFSQQSEVDNITVYLHEKYFGGYWGNFNLSVVTCRNDSPLWISSEESMVDNCFDFFRERLRKEGHILTGTGFYFLDDQGGRSYYMGQLFFKLGNNMTNGLFIELYSDVDAFQAGYSELLLDKKYQGYVKLKDYSFAKYINGNLVLRTGDFPYDKTDTEYIEKEYDYRIFARERYKHVLYKNGNITVLISERRVTTLDVVISFAYIFAFILLISNLVLAVTGLPDLKKLFYFNFRQKLQISFIGILLFSFITVGILTAFFSIRQYQSRHLDNIKEKVNSIYAELEGKLSMEQELTTDWRDVSNASLNELLIKLSNIFNTDINLYALNGNLLATSRPEVFYRDLTSRRLNMDAFINLKDLTKSEYIQREKIASLEYVSAYVPFYNDANKLLAYLNLPYFRMQSVLAREISNVLVAVINFTLLLIVLTMSFAVIISGRLTSPLRMLSEGLASVELGKRSEHLKYRGHDEISEMVKQYNTMVDELQDSATKLANSEREYAWREMAKQVAHEIKNPLTPMKLNIQQLYKSWKDGIPGFEKKLERFTKNQIEYIETLSSIASAFSSFAKMPGAKPVEVNLLDQITTTLELFKNTEKITFKVNWPHQCKIMILADKEHLNGIFSNLIKNAIQSVPQEREGSIRISSELKGDRVVVSIADNGTGIPEELKANLFIPNFTTKSSGMGLGLSIVKRLVESANGKVWFESEQNKGSVFFVELPIIYTVERL
jgi:two-component system, NtrC family, nitrogen regulation sensor histidine kinase NtrY